MLKKSLPWFFMFLLLASCGQQTNESKLKQLSREEQLERASNWEIVDYRNILIRNEQGDSIPFDSMIALGRNQKIASDLYTNDQGEIVEAHIRPQTVEDSVFYEQLMKAYNDGPEAQLRQVDCSNLKVILDSLQEVDQASRQGGAPDPKEDFKNLEIAISIIENCGMPQTPEVDPGHVSALWLIFQHGTYRYMRAYFPHFKEAVKRGDLKASSLALMEDRILMGDKKPQKYGSQIRGSADGTMILYELDSPEYVNQRRAAVGLGPLEDYVAYWGIEFNIPQKQK